jgi:hypothetical protein
MRGDTDFSQTRYLDRWDEQGIKFIFGFDAVQPLVDRSETLPKSAWERLVRPPKYERKTEPRERPENVKERIVKEREFENIHLDSEHVAEFDYAPSSCKKAYRIVVAGRTLRSSGASRRSSTTSGTSSTSPTSGSLPLPRSSLRPTTAVTRRTSSLSSRVVSAP